MAAAHARPSGATLRRGRFRDHSNSRSGSVQCVTVKHGRAGLGTCERRTGSCEDARSVLQPLSTADMIPPDSVKVLRWRSCHVRAATVRRHALRPEPGSGMLTDPACVQLEGLLCLSQPWISHQ